MKYTNTNITGTTAVELSSTGNRVYKISICNTHSTDACTIALYLYKLEQYPAHTSDTDWTPPSDRDYTYYILKNYNLPKGGSLKLYEDDICNEYGNYSVYIQLGDSGSTVDTIVRSSFFNRSSEDSSRGSRDSSY